MDVMEVCRQLWGCRQHSDIPGQLLENFVKTPHGPYTQPLTGWGRQFGWPTEKVGKISAKKHFIWCKLEPIRNNLDKSLELKRAEEQSSLFEVEFYGYTSFERLQRLSGSTGRLLSGVPRDGGHKNKRNIKQEWKQHCRNLVVNLMFNFIQMCTIFIIVP